MQSKTVLIVEDDPASLDIFETILRHGGYEVVTARNGADGLRQARALLPDAVVVDIGLPDVPGFGVLDELSDDPATDSIPLIVCTVHVFQHDQVRARRAGADVFLMKPVDPRELLGAVNRLLRESDASPDDVSPDADAQREYARSRPRRV
ncbi:MAG TPA: response regulator [Longimicrobium sp.]|nr:response regulator [Longimicrobium sp.]